MRKEDILKQLYPVGTVLVYNEELFEVLNKFYVIEKIKGAQLYRIVEERG